jgi:superfamily I DNA and/or RNA helicase
LTFSNSQIYNNGIQSGAHVLKRAPRIACHVQLIDNSGCEEADAFSWKNEFKASIIKVTLKMDDDVTRIRKGVHQARTIVITPYKARVKVLMATLASIANLGIVEIATVDSFQGQEGDIVVLFTVRTRSVSFHRRPSASQRRPSVS